MSDTIRIEAETRPGRGKGAARSLRVDGKTPAVVYGGGREAKSIQIQTHAFEQLLRHHASEHLLMELSVDGEDILHVLLKDVQHNNVTGAIIHIDFQEISLKDKIHVELPLVLTGEANGVKNSGGVLEHLLREIEVECLPNDMLEELEVDISALEMGESLLVKDIPVDRAKMTVLSDPDLAIAAVAAPRTETEESEEEEVTDGSTPAEPEVIKEKKPDEDA